MSSNAAASDNLLTWPVTRLYGVGEERARLLARLGIETVGHLLLHRPRRYEDRRCFTRIASLQAAQPALIRGRVIAAGLKTFRRRTRCLYEVIVDDGTGRLHCRWWNQPYMDGQFHPGDELVVYGKVRQLRPPTIDHPETETVEGDEESFVHFDRITPIYPSTEGLSQRWLRALIWRVLQRWGHQIPDQPALPPLPPPFHPLPGHAQAIRWLHFPDTPEQAEWARQRLALEEFLALQQALWERRRRFIQLATALPCAGDRNRFIRPFLARLGFQLTGAQTRVLRQIRNDLGGRWPMRRLLQGDVGSGKTVVAACAALMALESGYSVALMAPTEILAEQHYSLFQRWFEPLGVPVWLYTGSRKTGPTSPTTAPAAPLLPKPDAALPEGVGLYIGTHALLSEHVNLPRLGLVIIDEQHRFGVAQRETLVRKGRYPHLLVMTATPIPRTLGLTLYGDLDVSVLDEAPPGRKPVRTLLRTTAHLPEVWQFVRSELAAGHQAYIICPRVEDTDAGAVRAVEQEYTLIRQALHPHPVGLMHGRLPAREKDRVMEAFRTGTIAALVSTSVIEVGVDVPRATVMVILNAETFGLAQLHQLRGRIGRSNLPAHCILVSDARSRETRQRLEVLVQTQDGFAIAEADLKLRGPGELLGQQQSGMPRLRFGDLLNDLPLIELARRLVRQEQTELEPHPATPQAPGPVAPASNTPTSKHAT
ncbi:ATP-dependent DNA helicase RecG [Limisphaera ngatamarikiensis]|uniref:Probable DNA 3'-5' helicase RecG n=1 Tax=Limisphaera ngatamarikiensis TaxID=1324935 RepID=A0A6M1RMP4_9BACT|nr:ATP-dependent DNA helicase RecG [Limisphaera ngatamarikiensis]NGO38005.1 ATP-dependent DNA helicase RecG [Limisphaera ngatamarikiensis]